MKGEHVLDFYPLLRMQRLGNIAVFQPWWNGSCLGPSLSCDLKTGSVQLVEHPDMVKSYVEVYGILGMLNLESSALLVVITGARQVATIRNFPVFTVTRTSVLSATGVSWSSADSRLCNLLKSAVDPKTIGRGMYFSAGGDVTLTTQKSHLAAAGASAWERSEHLLTWNRSLALALIVHMVLERRRTTDDIIPVEAGGEKFVPTVMMGFVSQIKDINFTREGERHTATLTLIARRSAKRPGTRQWRRGADAESNVANFVESEQIVEFADGSLQSSFVQVRGSIPLMWSQTPNLKYKIPITIGPSGRSEAALKSHIMSLLKHYGGVIAINLANQTGREGKLSAAYASAAESVIKEVPAFRFVPFDFHKQCGATNYKNLSILWDDIHDDYKKAGLWLKDSSGKTETQTSVFRTNCIDTLDRTNVVQGMLARRSLEHILATKGILKEEEEFIADLFPAFDRQFREIWADHGDEISRQYAGTGAMKSAFTRTGKRDAAGLLDDGVKSMTRYFLNNFRDGAKQDALDLITGNYIPRKQEASPFQMQISPAIPIFLSLTMLYMAVMYLQDMGGIMYALSLEGMKRVWLLVAGASIILRLVTKYGAHFVDPPYLRPDLNVPWIARK